MALTLWPMACLVVLGGFGGVGVLGVGCGGGWGQSAGSQRGVRCQTFTAAPQLRPAELYKSPPQST